MILEISKELEGYIRLDEIDSKSNNVWINKNISAEVLEEFANVTTQYKMVGFEGHAHNMDLKTHLECENLLEFNYTNTTIYRAIEYLREDVHEYLVEDDEDDYVEIVVNNIIKK